MIKRRLAPSERDVLRSGDVFVWEESDNKGSLERWTDGRRWSQSRMREPFLFYEEKIEITPEEKEAKAARRAQQRSSDPVTGLPITLSAPNPIRRQDRPNKPGGFTKQTYSAFVLFPGAQTQRKWHLVAYFLATDYMQLPTVEHYSQLRQIRVPDGIYVSSKNMSATSSLRQYGSDDEDYPSRPMTATGLRPMQYHRPSVPPQTLSGGYGDAEQSPASLYATPFPHVPRPSLSRSLSMGYNAAELDRASPSMPYSPHALSPNPSAMIPGRPEYIAQASPPEYSVSSIPRSATPGYFSRASSSMAIPSASLPRPPTYASRSPEDSRILDSFRPGL